MGIVTKLFQKIPFASAKNVKQGKQVSQILRIVLNQQDASFIDVGCHKGEVLKLALKFAPKGEHFAFEPIPAYYEKLIPDFQTYVNLYNVAISNFTGETEFNYVESNPSLSGIKERDYPKTEKINKITVKVETLDHYLKDLQSLDLIRIDVEGGEFDLLDGAKLSIFKFKPHILFEHQQGAADYYRNNPDKMWDILVEQLGMKINTLSGFLNKSKNITASHFRLLFETGQETYFIAYFD